MSLLGQSRQSISGPGRPFVRCAPNSDRRHRTAANDVKCQSRPSLHRRKAAGVFVVSDKPPYGTRCRDCFAISLTDAVFLNQKTAPRETWHGPAKENHANGAPL